jgi:hypothetical protein
VEKRRKERARKRAHEPRVDWSVRAGETALQTQGHKQDRATSELIMMIAKNAARTTRQHGNSNFLGGDKAA